MPPHAASRILNAVYLCVLTTDEFTFDAARFHVKALPYIQRIYNVKIKYVCVYKEYTENSHLMEGYFMLRPSLCLSPHCFLLLPSWFLFLKCLLNCLISFRICKGHEGSALGNS